MENLEIYSDLTEMFGKDYVRRYPTYEYNLTAGKFTN